MKRYKDVISLIKELTELGVLESGMSNGLIEAIEMGARGWGDHHETRAAVTNITKLVEQLLLEIRDKKLKP